MRYIVRLLISVPVLVLTACTPAHTVQNTELYARKLGLTNQYNIRRWYDRRIPADSRILVAVSDAPENQPGQLAAAVAKGLSPHFAAVDALSGRYTMANARREALRRQYPFLLAVQRIEQGASAFNETGGHSKLTGNIKLRKAGGVKNNTEPQRKTSDTSKDVGKSVTRIEIEMSLIDVVSDKTVDKFTVSANTAIYNPVGTDLDDLLAQPMNELGDDLAGR